MEEANKYGVYYCRPVKTSHNKFSYLHRKNQQNIGQEDLIFLLRVRQEFLSIDILCKLKKVQLY